MAERIKAIQANFPRFQPSLAVIQAGERPDSTTYVRMKSKAAIEAGIQFNHIKVPVESSAEEIVDLVSKLNNDEKTSGILVQLPLGDHIGAQGERQVTEAISPEKDVDGYVLHVFASMRHDLTELPASTPITLVTCLLAPPILSSPLAPLLAASVFWNPLE